MRHLLLLLEEKNGAIIARVFVCTQLFRTYARAIFADYVDGTSSIDIEPTTTTHGKITIGVPCMPVPFDVASRCSTIFSALPIHVRQFPLFYSRECEATM